MKRIVDGLTYNTETSRLVAKAEWDSEDQYSPHYGAKCESELYQTRGGAFFQVTTVHLETRDEAGYPREREKVEFDPLTPERAREWLLDGEIEVFSNPFEDPPEAEAEEEAGATIYTRMTASLKRDVDAAAEKAGVSANVWVTRCLEQCLKSQKAAAGGRLPSVTLPSGG
jgi:hypothetical protein